MNLCALALFVFVAVFYQCECSFNFPGQSDLVTSLPGLNATIPFRHYAGYLNATNDTFLYYWFFESQSQQANSDPVVLWLNGGPGCSSLFGALLENGPFRLKSNKTLTLNPYSWNSNANMLFIESPAGVGFSYKANVPNDYDYPTDDNETTQLNFEALRSFYQKFPQFISNDFYLTGESYAGIYLPLLSTILLDRKFPLNFKGVSLGNPMLDQRYLYNTQIQFAHQNNFLNESIWKSLLSNCCPPNSSSIRFGCAFQNITTATYPFIEPSNCRNMYHETVKHMLEFPRNLNNYQEMCSERTDGFACVDPFRIALQQWLNRPDVQEALHIVRLNSTHYQWNDCTIELYASYQKNTVSVLKQIQRLLKKNIRVLLYYGDLDLACTYISGQWFIDDLNVTAVNRKPTPWFYGNQIAATMNYFTEGLVYVKIKDAGHETVRDKPAFAKDMFDRFLNSSLFYVKK